MIRAGKIAGMKRTSVHLSGHLSIALLRNAVTEALGVWRNEAGLSRHAGFQPDDDLLEKIARAERILDRLKSPAPRGRPKGEGVHLKPGVL